MTAMAEIWRPVPGFEGLYEVSNLGHVRSLARIVTRADGKRRTFRPRQLKPVLRGRDLLASVSLSKGSTVTPVYLHTLVRQVFDEAVP